MKRLTLCIAALAAWLVAAQAANDKKYQQMARQVRQEIWSKDLPAFRQTSCPEQYRNYSKVVLAAYEELAVGQHTSTNALQLLLNMGTTSRMVTANHYERQLVAINDEQARREFSEFDFATVQKGWTRGWRQQRQTVVGVRVVKPSGEVREVSTDEFVTVDEGRGNRQQRQKLAVPDLQVGDLIDAFWFTSDDIEENNPGPYAFSFISDVPMLSYQVHCTVGPAFTVQYRTLNGAPDFTATTDAGRNMVLDAEVRDVEQTEPRLWYSHEQQSPQVLEFIDAASAFNAAQVVLRRRGAD